LYLPFLSELDGKLITHVRKVSRQKSEDIQKFTADTRKPLIDLTLNGNIQGRILDMRKSSSRTKKAVLGTLSALGNPYNSVMNFKRSVFDLKKSTSNLRRGIKETPLKELKKAYLKQDKKRRQPILKENTSPAKEPKTHYTARTVQKYCNETVEYELDYEKVLCEKIANERNISQTMIYSEVERQAENYVSKIEKLERDSEMLKANNKELEQLITRLKKTYTTILKKELNNIVEYIVKEVAGKIKESLKKCESSILKLSECNEVLQQKFKEEIKSNKILKSAIDILRNEKEKVEATCREFEEENRTLEAELNECREELEKRHNTSMFREELKEYKVLAYKSINATRNDEYYAMEAELNNSKAKNLELQVQLAKEQKEFISERNNLLTTTFELRRDIKSLKEVHEQEISKLNKENKEEIIRKEDKLKELIKERDHILKKLNEMKSLKLKKCKT
jgi:DNA repair exonuclease SbcCD ATPase subunit